MQVRMVGATDVGRRRKSNQDSLYYDEPAGFGIVADGIGTANGKPALSFTSVITKVSRRPPS